MMQSLLATAAIQMKALMKKATSDFIRLYSIHKHSASNATRHM